MGYNRFGAAFSSVVALYPGSVVSDFGGQTTVEEAIDRAVDRVANALTEDVYGQLTEPDLELVVRRATAGQTSATLGLYPVVSGSVHVWVGQPVTFQNRPRLETDPVTEDVRATEISSSLFSVVDATGALTLPALVANDQVYASYRVDPASLSVPSLARICIRGAAAELGARLYTEGNQEWALVTRYREDFEAALDGLSGGTVIPDELRAMRWWAEVKPAGFTGGSVRLGRG